MDIIIIHAIIVFDDDLDENDDNDDDDDKDDDTKDNAYDYDNGNI